MENIYWKAEELQVIIEQIERNDPDESKDPNEWVNEMASKLMKGPDWTTESYEPMNEYFLQSRLNRSQVWLIFIAEESLVIVMYGDHLPSSVKI